MRTWLDSSSLIGLDRIGKIRLLHTLLDRVFITPEVAAEVRAGQVSEALSSALGKWILIRPAGRGQGRIRAHGLGDGESSLLRTPAADRLVLDDLPARRVAEAEGRDFTGLLGLLRSAALSGTITNTQCRETIDRLLEHGFHVSAPLYAELLRSETTTPSDEE